MYAGRTNWESKKENLKARYPVLTDEDLCYENHTDQNMIEKLKVKLGMTSDELDITILTL